MVLARALFQSTLSNRASPSYASDPLSLVVTSVSLQQLCTNDMLTETCKLLSASCFLLGELVTLRCCLAPPAM